jgi:hypothetical protein
MGSEAAEGCVYNAPREAGGQGEIRGWADAARQPPTNQPGWRRRKQRKWSDSLFRHRVQSLARLDVSRAVSLPE